MAEKPAVLFAIPEGSLVRKNIFTSENKNLIRAMKKAAKDLAERGLSSEATGNMSARVDDGFLISATGSRFASLSDDDFVLVQEFDFEKEALGKAFGLKTPSSDTPVHYQVYARRPDVRAIIHAHDAALAGEDAARKLKLPITGSELKGGTREAAEAVAGLLASGDAVIIKNHGIFVVGKSIEECADRLITLHRRAR